MIGRHFCVFPISGHAVQSLELGPARRKRHIDVHRPKIGFDRLWCVSQGHITVTPLLVQTAEARVVTLEAIEGRECRGNLAEITKTHGRHVQNVAVLGDLLGKCVRGCESIGVAALLEQSANADDFCLDRRGRRCARLKLRHHALRLRLGQASQGT